MVTYGHLADDLTHRLTSDPELAIVSHSEQGDVEGQTLGEGE